MNEPGGFQRYNEAMSRRYTIGGAGPVFTFATDAFPIVPISDELMDFDLRAIAGVRTFGAYRELAASVGNLSIATMVNPAASAVLGIIEEFEFWSDSAINVQASMVYSVLVPGTSQYGVAFDTRSSQLYTGSSVIRLGTLNQAAAPTNPGLVYGRNITANSTTSMKNVLPLVIQPGTSFALYSTGANVNLRVTCRWRERVFNQNEIG